MTAMAFSAICYPDHFSFFCRPRANNNTGHPFKLCDHMLVKIYLKKYELIDRYAISWNAANVIHWYAILNIKHLNIVCCLSENGAFQRFERLRVKAYRCRHTREESLILDRSSAEEIFSKNFPNRAPRKINIWCFFSYLRAKHHPISFVYALYIEPGQAYPSRSY